MGTALRTRNEAETGLSESAASVHRTALEGKLYGLRGAPPSYAAELMLRHKGVRYRRVNLLPGRHRRTLPAKGFPGGTAPALELDGLRVQTNRAIARLLDERVPAPSLFPADPIARANVEEAECFGDEVLQPRVRRLTLWSLCRDYDSVVPHPAIGRLLVPRQRWLQQLLMPRVFAYYGITEAVDREDRAQLPRMLDRLDGFVAAGVLDGPEPTAADFQIAPLIAMLLGHVELRPEIERRPVASLAGRLVLA